MLYRWLSIFRCSGQRKTMVEALPMVSYLSTWPMTTTLMCIFSLPMIAVLSLERIRCIGVAEFLE